MSWIAGSTHTIATAATQTGGTGTQYVWSSWSDSGALSHSITVAATPSTYTAAFTTQYYLTTVSNPAAGGTIAPASGWFYAGASVQVSATAAAGYQFSNFSGALTGSTNPQTLVLNTQPRRSVRPQAGAGEACGPAADSGAR